LCANKLKHYFLGYERVMEAGVTRSWKRHKNRRIWNFGRTTGVEVSVTDPDSANFFDSRIGNGSNSYIHLQAKTGEPGVTSSRKGTSDAVEPHQSAPLPQAHGWRGGVDGSGHEFCPEPAGRDPGAEEVGQAPDHHVDGRRPDPHGHLGHQTGLP